MSCDRTRERLLDLLYEALEPSDERALRAHLESCADCRAALEEARSQKAVLADAARLAGDGLSFTAPTKARGRIFTRGRLAAAAAMLAAVAVGGFTYRSLERRQIRGARPVVAVTGPRTFQAGAPAEFLVRAGRADVEAQLYRGGKPVGEPVAPSAPVDGARRVRFDIEDASPGEHVFVRFTASLPHSKHGSELFDLPLLDATRLVTRIGTDKPIYRPGDTVRVRAVALEGFRLTPAGDVSLRMRLEDPRGAVVFDHQLPTASGVTAWHHALPEGAPGGAYKLTVSGPQGGPQNVGASERTFIVRSYRVPRLKFDLELDRDSYGPGDPGEAYLSVERVEGGVPEGASVDAIVRVDGNEVSRETLTLDATGKLAVSFTLPAEIAEGRGQIALVVKDGGNVETTAKTVPIVLGRLDVELFPEGGDLVAGLPTRVYFRAKSPSGEPADLEAELQSSDGTVVAQAKVDVLGMGAFELTPRAGETYRLVATKPTGVTVAAEFPNVLPAGAVLRAADLTQDAGGAIDVSVASTRAGRHQLVASCRGVMIAQAQVTLGAGDVRRVSLDPFSSVGGVVRVTLLDASGTPLAERLVSRTPSDGLDIEIAPEHPRYAPGEKVKINVTARDEQGRPSQTILGVTVVDDGVLALANDEDTAPQALHFLLGMEVEELEKAEIFTDGEKGALAVDRLLGVQGWRRFAWRDPAQFLDENPVTGARVVAVGSDETPQSYDNESAVASETQRSMRRVDRNLVQAGVGIGLLVLLFGGLGVGILGAWQRRPAPAIAGFAAAALVIGIAAFPRMLGQDNAVARDVWEAAGVPVGAVGAPASGPAHRGAPTPEELFERKLVEEFREQNAAEIKLVVAGKKRLGRLVADMEEMDADGAVADAKWAFPQGDIPPDARDPSDPPPPPDGFGQGDVAGGRFAVDKEMARRWRKNWQRRNIYRYYAHSASPGDGSRSDFTEVLYWHPLLVTDEAGKASFEFDTSDSITTFRVAVEAHDGRGALADTSTTIQNRVPFYLEPKFPVALSAGDVLDLPLVVANDTQNAFGVDVELSLAGDLLRPRDGTSRSIDLAGGARGRALIPLVARQGLGSVTLDVIARGGDGLTDRTKRTISVVPRGYPMSENLSGVLEVTDGATVRLPGDLNRLTLEGALKLYPSTLATLVDGLESMLRSPGGCFEQASSSNYPNVMVLNYLSEQDAVEPAVARKAKEMLDRGYKLLTGYECSKKGYEWFGGDPGHEALTAYGLMEFVDMERVYDVDTEMVGRTRDWLLARRDGKGGFERNARALDTFGRASPEITDTYIVWAITEADTDIDIDTELALLEKRARESDDPYLIALAANALANRELPGAKHLIEKLADMQQDDGRLAGKKTSITGSRGPNLDMETTALAAVAFTKSPARAANAVAAVRYMLENCRGGSFGATQATILALRALVAHAKATRKTSSSHDLTILVNGEEVAKRHVPEGAAGVILFDREILDALRPGENDVELRTSGKETLPWALSVKYHTSQPPSDPDCPVGVTTILDTDRVAEGETVGLEVTVTNRTEEGLPMTLARVGLPAGLEARADQLEELRESGAIGFYETRPREVTIYFRDMAPGAEKKIDLDLVAAIPGEFEGPATSAYLYYGDDQKDWAAPTRIRIDASGR